MSSTEPGASAPDAAGDVRPLPARPSLQFERIQAKKLLAFLREGDPESLNRVRRVVRRAESHGPEDFQLADAQFAIAREYGFQSWPRLVEYFTMLARHERSPRTSPESFVLGEGSRSHVSESAGRALLAQHRARQPGAASLLAAFVPRFFALSHEQVFAAEPTLAEARLAAARMRGFPSWEAMAEASQPQRPRSDEWERYATPLSKALRTLHGRDDARLDDLVRAHPGLLTESPPGQPGCIVLPYVALNGTLRTDPARAIGTIAWLGRRIDLQSTLNWLLLGRMGMSTEAVRILLDHGADPGWMPPNGLTVLEHAIASYWNGEAIDLIAARVTPPRAFWVAAGLGDVDAVSRYVDRRGRPTAAARKHRPDYMALSHGLPPFNPAAEDRTIVWEAFLAAALNQRFAVLDLLLDRGFPVNHDEWGMPLLHMAIGNGWVSLVEYLVSHGADLDRRGPQPQTAREVAESSFKNPHVGPSARRILELCGGRDPEVLVRERDDERSSRALEQDGSVNEAIAFAKHDAARQQQTIVTPENLFVALLYEGRFSLEILWSAGVDLERLRASVGDRLEAPAAPAGADITVGEDVIAILVGARVEAERRFHHAVTTFSVLMALIEKAPEAVNRILEPAGASVEQVRSHLVRLFDTL